MVARGLTIKSNYFETCDIRHCHGFPPLSEGARLARQNETQRRRTEEISPQLTLGKGKFIHSPQGAERGSLASARTTLKRSCESVQRAKGVHPPAKRSIVLPLGSYL